MQERGIWSAEESSEKPLRWNRGGDFEHELILIEDYEVFDMRGFGEEIEGGDLRNIIVPFFS